MQRRPTIRAPPPVIFADHGGPSTSSSHDPGESAPETHTPATRLPAEPPLPPEPPLHAAAAVLLAAPFARHLPVAETWLPEPFAPTVSIFGRSLLATLLREPSALLLFDASLVAGFLLGDALLATLPPAAAMERGGAELGGLPDLPIH